MNPYSVLLRPIISEKSSDMRDNEQKYCFYVKTSASKLDVRAAVEKMYDVKVASVNTSILRGKVKRRRQFYFKESNRKKAVVTLVDGAKLPIFED